MKLVPPRTAVGTDATAQVALILRVQIASGQPMADVIPVLQVKDNVDFGAIGPMSDNIGTAPVAQGQPQGVDEDGFAGAGFAAEDGETRGELQVQGLDDGEVVDLNRREHDRLAYTNGRHGWPGRTRLTGNDPNF